MSTRCPFAIWEPVVNHTPGRVIRPPEWQVTHTAVTPQTLGALQGVVNYFNNPASQVSSHYVVGIDGTIIQCVDLDDEAWCQMAGNPGGISVENIGDGTKEPFTDRQVTANARLLAFHHETYGLPLQIATNMGMQGLTWHGMGCPSWGHCICSGSFTIAQLPLILARAQAIVTPPKPKPPVIHSPEADMFLFQEKGSAAVNVAGPGARGYSHVDTPARLAEWRQILGALNPSDPLSGAIFPVSPGFAAALAAGAGALTVGENVAEGPAVREALALDAADEPILA